MLLITYNLSGLPVGPSSGAGEGPSCKIKHTLESISGGTLQMAEPFDNWTLYVVQKSGRTKLQPTHETAAVKSEDTAPEELRSLNIHT